jgi:hypothetical protein
MVEGAGDDADQVVAAGDVAKTAADAGQLAGPEQFVAPFAARQFHSSGSCEA